jgi:trehalose/maltose hydrolase-like predicted phosphorylase
VDIPVSIKIRRIEAAAIAPYPIAGDIQIAGVWMSDSPHLIVAVDQSYDFASGELTSRFEFVAGDVKARVEVLTFCSRDLPSLVCQEIVINVDTGGQLAIKSLVDARNVDGQALRYLRETPGEPEPACDGLTLWESAGRLSN